VKDLKEAFGEIIRNFTAGIKIIQIKWLDLQIQLAKVGIGQGTGSDLLDSSIIGRLIRGKDLSAPEQKTANATIAELEATKKRIAEEGLAEMAPAGPNILRDVRYDERPGRNQGNIIRPGPRSFEGKDLDPADEARKRVAELQATIAALPALTARAREAAPDVADFTDKSKNGVLGTFSGATASLQFGGADRLPDKVDETNRLLRQILDRGGLTFE
jgi:hypothetical protein